MIFPRSRRAFWLGLLLGLVLGFLTTEAAKALLPPGPVKELLTRYVGFGVSPFEINLVAVKITLGFWVGISALMALVVITVMYIMYKIL